MELEEGMVLEVSLELDGEAELDKGTELELRVAVLEARIELDTDTDFDEVTELKERVEVMSIELLERIEEAKTVDEEHATVVLTATPTLVQYEAQTMSSCSERPTPRSQAWRQRGSSTTRLHGGGQAAVWYAGIFMSEQAAGQ